jgi:hypothetical protein
MTPKVTSTNHRKLSACILSLAAWTLLTVSSASAATVISYTDAASFLGAVQSSYLENFDSSTAGQQSGPVSFSSGIYQYSVDVPNDSVFFLENPSSPGDFELSTSSTDFSIVFTFGAGINAVGGNFFATDTPGNVTAGVITVTLNDGTTQILTDASATTFSGFVSAGTAISSLTVSTGGTGIYATVDNFYTGVAAAPEPGSVLMILGGLSALAPWLRRRKA